MHYRDFDLFIDDVQGGGVLARARCEDDRGRAEVDLPVFQNELSRIKQYQEGDASPGTPEGVLGQAEFLGSRLFSSVFHGNLLDCWLRARASVGEKEGLRIRLHLGSAELASIPWELMRDLERRDSLGVSSRFPISRRLDHSKQALPRARFPVGLLICDSVPDRRAPLQIETEAKAVQGAWKDLQKEGKVHIERLRNGTLEELLKKLGEGRWHILHFIGHGTSKGLKFKTSDGGERRVGRQDWGVVGENVGSLRLVVLNCCDSAASTAGELFSSVVEELSRSGVPAVVGMRSPIDDQSAVIFARWFYGELAKGRPVDTAAAGARRALFLKVGRGCRRPVPPESIWSTPVVYLSFEDGQVIDWPAVGDLAGQPQRREGRSRAAWAKGGRGFMGLAPSFWTLFAVALLMVAYLLWNTLDWSSDPNRPRFDVDLPEAGSPTEPVAPPSQNPPSQSQPSSNEAQSDLVAHLFFRDVSQGKPLSVFCIKKFDPQLGQRLAKEHSNGHVVVYLQCLKQSRTEPALRYLNGERQTYQPSPDDTQGQNTIQKLIDNHSGDRTGAQCWSGASVKTTAGGSCSHNKGVMNWSYAERDANKQIASICSDWRLLSATAGNCGPGGTLAEIYNRVYN